MTPIYFATGRIPVNPPNPTDFGTDPNPLGTVTFGKALVADASATADLRQPLTLQQTSTGTFWEALQDEIVKGTARTLVLNLHGFDYTFGESIVGAAKLIGWYGAGRPSAGIAMVCFCWPSRGRQNLDDYRVDYARATGSGDAFRQFLRAIVPIIGAFRAADPANRRVVLLAHSMGNHVLRAGLQSALGTATGQYNPAGLPPLLDAVILAAADEDADALSHGDKLAPLGVLARRVYVYYHNQDVPLNTLSRTIHGTSRLGINGAPDKVSFRAANVTFVNCSAAYFKNDKGEDLDPTGHQYYRIVPAVRDDICSVISGLADDKIANRLYRSDDNYFRVD
jgi:esterase/lipase superfamily enzyme